VVAARRERERLDWEQFKRETEPLTRLDCLASVSMFGGCAGNAAESTATVAYHLMSLPWQMLTGMADDSGGRSKVGYVHPFDRRGGSVNPETGGYDSLILGRGGFGGGLPSITRRTYTKTEKIDQARKHGGKCEYCGVKIDLKKFGTSTSLHGDHILPYWLNPQTLRLNLASTCRHCNLSKGGKTIGPGPNEWWPPLWGPKPPILNED
jgi:hypothetical protein